MNKRTVRVWLIDGKVKSVGGDMPTPWARGGERRGQVYDVVCDQRDSLKKITALVEDAIAAQSADLSSLIDDDLNYYTRLLRASRAVSLVNYE